MLSTFGTHLPDRTKLLSMGRPWQRTESMLATDTILASPERLKEGDRYVE